MTAQPATQPAAALCATEGDPNDWFPPPRPGGPSEGKVLAAWQAGVDRVRQVCGRCPVRSWCAETYWREPHGIIAGTLPEERGWPSTERGKLRLISAGGPPNTNGPAGARPLAERKKQDPVTQIRN